MGEIVRDEKGRIIEPCKHCHLLSIRTTINDENGEFNDSCICLAPTNICRKYYDRLSSKDIESTVSIHQYKNSRILSEAIDEHLLLISDCMTACKKGEDKVKNIGKMLAYSESLRYLVEAFQYCLEEGE